MGEVCGTFSTRDFVETSGDCPAKALDRVGGTLKAVGGDLAEDGFELGEQLFDRIEIGAVCRKIDEDRTAPFDGFSHTSDLVNGDVVHEHDISSFKGRSQTLFDIGPERLTVHRAFKHERRAHAVVTQRRDECRGLPVAVQHLHDQALSARGTAVEASDIAGDAGFIDENQPLWVEPWLSPSQRLAIGRDVRSILLGGVQAFF